MLNSSHIFISTKTTHLNPLFNFLYRFNNEFLNDLKNPISRNFLKSRLS